MQDLGVDDDTRVGDQDVQVFDGLGKTQIQSRGPWGHWNSIAKGQRDLTGGERADQADRNSAAQRAPERLAEGERLLR